MQHIMPIIIILLLIIILILYYDDEHFIDTNSEYPYYLLTKNEKNIFNIDGSPFTNNIYITNSPINNILDLNLQVNTTLIPYFAIPISKLDELNNDSFILELVFSYKIQDGKGYGTVLSITNDNTYRPFFNIPIIQIENQGGNDVIKVGFDNNSSVTVCYPNDPIYLYLEFRDFKKNTNNLSEMIYTTKSGYISGDVGYVRSFNIQYNNLLQVRKPFNFHLGINIPYKYTMTSGSYTINPFVGVINYLQVWPITKNFEANVSFQILDLPVSQEVFNALTDALKLWCYLTGNNPKEIIENTIKSL